MPTFFSALLYIANKCSDGSFLHSSFFHQHALRQLTSTTALVRLGKFASNTNLVRLGHSLHPLNPFFFFLLGASRAVVPTECQQAVCKGSFPQQPYGHTEASGRQCCLL